MAVLFVIMAILFVIMAILFVILAILFVIMAILFVIMAILFVIMAILFVIMAILFVIMAILFVIMAILFAITNCIYMLYFGFTIISQYNGLNIIYFRIGRRISIFVFLLLCSAMNTAVVFLPSKTGVVSWSLLREGLGVHIVGTVVLCKTHHLISGNNYLWVFNSYLLFDLMCVLTQV